MKPPSERTGQVTAASELGERDHQEDRSLHHWMENPSIPGGTGWLLAVFDGHRGAETADKASKALSKLFETYLLAHAGNIPETLRSTFSSLSEQFQRQLPGSTASVVFIPREAQTVYVAVLGDSPIAILDAKGAIHIGPEHNVRTNIKERAAAEARGGVYQGGYLEDSELPGVGLQMARSLGDADLNRVLNREPEIQSVPLGGKGIVLVGSDGLFAPGTEPWPQQLTKILEMIRKGASAEEVVKDALARHTGDNVTAIVWRS